MKNNFTNMKIQVLFLLPINAMVTYSIEHHIIIMCGIYNNDRCEQNKYM